MKTTTPFFSRGDRLRPNSGDALLALLREWGGTISDERGVRWCEEFERGRPLFIVSTTRPNGMGRRWCRSIGGLLAMLYGFNARVGAVSNGLEHVMLCAAEAASSTASGGCKAWA